MCLKITQPSGLVCTVVSLEGELSSQNCVKIDPKNDYNQDYRSTESVGKNVAKTAGKFHQPKDRLLPA